MTAAVAVGDAGLRTRSAARRAVLRWSWRLFKREWRQQVLVLTLVTVAVAGTVFGLGFATNAGPHATTTVTIPGSDPQLDADLAALTATLGPGEVIHHQRATVPGSVGTLDVRSQETAGRHRALRLVAGRFPATADEAAVTGQAAALLGMHIGDTWSSPSQPRPRRVVGLVENPENFDDQFVLVPPGGADPPTTVTVLVHGTPDRVGPIRIPSGLPIGVEGVSATDKALVAITVLAFASLSLLLVALVAVAGFAVVAQRHLRALGMLGSLGATDSHTQLVLIGDGAAVGAVGSVVGLAAGLAIWLAFAPRLENVAGHRIDRLNLPWWAMVVGAILAVLAATAAAWWPGRALRRVSVVEALSGRPPRPRPARSFGAAGVLVAAVGTIFIVLANRTDHKSPLLVVVGVVTATIGVLLFAPLAIAVAAKLSARLPVAPRLALRDLGRYQARAGAALGAVALALAIATTVSLAAAYRMVELGPTPKNLPDNQVVVYLSQDARGPVPDVTDEQLRAAQQSVDAIAVSLGTHDVLPLELAVDPSNPDRPPVRGSGQPGREPAALLAVTPVGRGFGVDLVRVLHVATPAVLAHLHLSPGQIDPSADVVVSPTTLRAIRDRVGTAQLMLGANPRGTIVPKIQTADLPDDTSGPTALLTSHGLEALRLATVPGGWLVTTGHPLSDRELSAARKAAGPAGLGVESRSSRRDFARIGNDATAIGVLFALGVLAVTVGLIRAESAQDLRTLTATGASGWTRRTLTGVTAATLGLLGAVLGTASAYLSISAWYHAHLSPLRHPPVANLLTISLLLPAIAGVAGFVLAGREPPAIARRPLD